MAHWLGRWGLLLALGAAGLGLNALAAPYTLRIDDRSISIDGTPDSGSVYVPLLPLLQALGGGVRPVGFDYASSSIQLTRGDGSKTVNASFRLVGGQPYIDALRAAAGLGYQVKLSGTTLTISTQAAAPATPGLTATPGSVYPKGFSAAEFEGVARQLIDELQSGNTSGTVLQAVLNGSGLPVFGTQNRPADGDVLEIYQALHHPFSTVLELYTLRAGFQFRLFTPIDAYLSSVTGSKALTARTLPGSLGNLFGGDPSRSQVVLALVGAIGRERARRGISVSGRRDAFWGDDMLDPVQLRLLSAVLETGQGPEKTALNRRSQAGPQLLWATYRPPLLAQLGGPGNDDATAPKSITDFFGKVADKAVSEIVKEVYPEGSNWLDNAVQDALGIPIVLPISPKLLEGLLKGDTEGVKATWKGLLGTAAVETAKDGARAVFCGSIVLYGYHSSIQADPATISHRTAGDEAGPSLSRQTVTLTYAGDYRDQVFKAPVRYASRLALKTPLTTVGELLERLGCELPKDDPKNGVTPVGGKEVEWELTGDLPDHINGGAPDFADKVTTAGGAAKAQFRAVDEQMPKAFRVAQQSSSGNLFVRFKNLLPQKWWLVQAAAQFGQDTAADTNDTGKAGSSSQRLTVKFYGPPKLTLTFHTVVQGSSDDAKFRLELDARVPLEPKWNGEPGDPRSKFIGYEGVGTLFYKGHSLTAKCGTRIAGVHDGKLEVRVLSESFDSPQLTVIVNPGFSIGSVYPREDIVAGTPTCLGGGNTVGLWFGSWLDAYSAEPNKLIGTLPGQSFGGVILRGTAQKGNTLFSKTLNGKGQAFGADITDVTDVKIETAP